MTRVVRLYTPGIVPYHDAWDWQQEAASAVCDGAPESIGVLQHTPVYTLGCRANTDNLLVDAFTLDLRGAEVVQTDRGGDVTFHGPGQLVVYPVLNLRARNLAAADYVRLLEDVMLRTCETFGVKATRSPGRPGIWADDAKLGAVGVRIQRGVSLHGLALNVDVDLSWFDAIVPCGLSGLAVTSLQRVAGRPVHFSDVEHALLDAFEPLFDCRLVESWSPRPQGAAAGVS